LQPHRATELQQDGLGVDLVLQLSIIRSGGSGVLRGARGQEAGEEPSREVAYAITSVPPVCAGPSTLLGWWRGHWGIENGSHHMRDVTMGEDGSRIRSGAAPQVKAAWRNAAVGFLRCRGVVNVAETLRRKAAQVRPLLLSLGIVKQGSALGTVGTGVDRSQDHGYDD
jgi:hypothetical protein